MLKNGSRVLGITPRGLLFETKLQVLVSNVIYYRPCGSKVIPFFLTKLVIKPREVDLGKNEKNPSGEFSYLSFAVTRLKIGLKDKKCEKTTLKLHKAAYPALGNPPGIHNIYNSRCHQNLSDTININRIEIGLVEKNQRQTHKMDYMLFASVIRNMF